MLEGQRANEYKQPEQTHVNTTTRGQQFKDQQCLWGSPRIVHKEKCKQGGCYRGKRIKS